MASIDDMIAALLIGNSDYEMKQDPLYNAGAGLLSQKIDYSQMNPWAAAAIGLGQGLVGSGMQEWGKSRAEDRALEQTKAFQAFLDSGDESLVKDFPRMAQAAAAMKLSEDVAGRTALNEAAKTAIGQGRGQINPDEAPEWFKGYEPYKSGDAGSDINVGGDYLTKKTMGIARRLRMDDPTLSSTQAMITARNLTTPEKEQLEKTLQKIAETRTAGQDVGQYADRFEQALADVGYTGKGGGFAQWLSGYGSLGSEEQKKKYSAGQSLENEAANVVRMFGKAFKGPMSDRDVQLMLKAAPSVSNTPEANQAIVQNFRFAQAVQEKYADFMTEAIQGGKSVMEAEADWGAIRRGQPYVVDGKPNPFWVMQAESLSPIDPNQPDMATGSWGEDTGGVAMQTEDPRLKILADLKAELARLQSGNR